MSARGSGSDEAQRAPLWLELSGRRVTMIGGGPVATRRARGFVADGARVIIVAPEVTPELEDLAERGIVRWVQREYSGAGDLRGAWLVHAATGDLDVDLAVADDAEDQCTFCIVASRSTLGTATVPARTRVSSVEGTVQVAVDGGRDPRRAMAVRDAVSALLCTGGVDLSSRRPQQESRPQGVGTPQPLAAPQPLPVRHVA